MSVRTRFAPSPTGYLHIGGARTALFSYLHAKKNNGAFILRIEDTDLERSTDESVQAILDGMSWLGLHCDEGPFYQTKRFDRYKEVIQKLIENGHAYQCYCSKERLTNLREEQMANKQKPRYDGHCRELNRHDDNAPYVIRFRNPATDAVSFDDHILGTISFNNSELDDLIIARTDGTPTYNLTVVVDDWDMQITHVIRGNDHVNNTPRQINIFKALNADIPTYAHVPMILGSDGKRLSKRHGAVSVMQYRDDGFLPQALLNYLVRLGWSYGDQEVFSLDEMIQLFNLDKVNKAAAVFNEEKLLWLNHYYIKNLPSDTLLKQLQWHLDQLKINVNNGPDIKEVIDTQRERCKTLKDLAEKSRFFYSEPTEYDEKAVKKNFTPETKTLLENIHQQFSTMNDWTDECIHEVILSTAEKLELKLGKVAQPIRIAVTGGTVSPPIDATLRLLGKKQTLDRIVKTIEYIG